MVAQATLRAEERPRAESRRGERSALIAVGAASALVAITAIWGSALARIGAGIGLHAPPLFAAASNRLSVRIVVPLVVAGLIVWRGPALALRLSWRSLLVAATVVTMAWGVGLALVDFGITDGLVRGVGSPVDFLAGIDRIVSPGPFVDSFVERIDSYAVHVRGHPPGLTVAMWWMDRIGLGGSAPVVTLCIGGAAAAVVAALVALKDVAGELAARRTAPFLVIGPAAIWLVSSSDAIYAGIGAIGSAALIVATGRAGIRSDALALLGGLALGCGLFLSYGLVLLLLVPFVVAASRRRLRPLVVAGTAIVAVALAFAAFGFSWVDGLSATRGEYAASIAAIRPYGYFVFANLAAFAVALGPAPIAGLVQRNRRPALLVGAALAAIIAADLSGLSKGEVERIWLPFWPWVAVAAAGLSTHIRWWLAGQAAVAIGVQTFLGTPW